MTKRFVVRTTLGEVAVGGAEAELSGGWLTIYSGDTIGDTPTKAAQFKTSVVLAWREVA